MSAPHTGRIYPPGNIPITHLQETAAGRIMSTNNSNDTIGNRTRELSVCSTVPQLTAPRRAAGRLMSIKNSNDNIGNRAREVSGCSTLSQLNVTPRASHVHFNVKPRLIHVSDSHVVGISCFLASPRLNVLDTAT